MTFTAVADLTGDRCGRRRRRRRWLIRWVAESAFSKYQGGAAARHRWRARHGALRWGRPPGSGAPPP